MPKHEHFEELCAAASVGQATPEELVELEGHAAECATCRQTYADYLHLAARQFAAAEHNLTLSPQEAEECLNSELFIRRFFERAEREGIVFSRDVGREAGKASPISFAVLRRNVWNIPVTAAAAVALIAVAVSAIHLREKGQFSDARAPISVKTNQSPAQSEAAKVLEQRVVDLTAINSKLQAQVNQMSAELRNASVRLTSTETDLESSSQERRQLILKRDSLEAELENVRQELVASEAAAANAQQEVAKLRNHASDVDATLVVDEVKIHELKDELGEKSAALDREGQLLVNGKDVTELMAARNFHIVDVVDTDPRGKTQPAFGRIFFTAGKSLIFYAYDLNEAKMQKASYQYKVWARKEGEDKEVKNLGIFFSDDKAQRRWVFKCDDPKVLAEIDSVFVTLEPAGGDPSHPKGPNLMYAYLRGQPNHP